MSENIPALKPGYHPSTFGKICVTMPRTQEELRLAHNERNRRYRERHPDRIKRIADESNAKRRAEKTRWANERYAAMSEEEREPIRARARAKALKWAEDNRNRSRQKAHEYYWANREEILAASRVQKQKNAEYARRRCRTDPTYRLLKNLRCRLHCALKRKGLPKTNRTFDLVGCSIAVLREHLERQFREGMTWENYGRWHVDHRRPCASFNLADPEQLRACFHFSNLQPLWAQENHIKSSKVIHEGAR